MWAYALPYKEFNNESNKKSPTIKNKRSFYMIRFKEQNTTTAGRSSSRWVDVAEQPLAGLFILTR